MIDKRQSGNVDVGNVDGGNVDVGNVDGGNVDVGNVDGGNVDDPYDLIRFVKAQEDAYERALSEIKQGRKFSSSRKS